MISMKLVPFSIIQERERTKKCHDMKSSCVIDILFLVGIITKDPPWQIPGESMYVL